MIHRFVKLNIKEECRDGFNQILKNYHHNVPKFEGCLFLNLLAEPNSNLVITYSGWESEERLELYRKSELFINFWKSIKPFFAQKAEAYSTFKIEF